MACADVQTIQAGNGSKTQFSFDFPYLFKSEITVSFWNATTKEWDAIATTDATYPWRVTDANPTIVEFTSTAPPSPATPVDPGETAVDNVRIRRVTNIDDIRALFNPGSAIRSDDLNKNFEQLRYAIQEANCQGVPDDIYQYLLDNYWDRFDNTLYDGDTWVSNDTKIATSAALDDRIDSKIDAAINNDIESDGTGITVTDGPGTITLGLADNSIDFDKLKDADQIQLADQVANYEVSGSDDKIFTASAAIRRFENYVQNSTPSTSGIGKGAVWVDEDDDLTLSVWNGSAWLGITSGGTFTNQPKVVYVDASSGSDENDGHRISRPKATIKAAINQINADATYGDGSVVVVAAGVYQEAAPIQIQKRDVSIVGTSLRSCVIHPTPATETNNLFEVNSGTYLQNLTFTGVKASGTRGAAGSLWQDATYGLPPTQGWNVAFLAGATIVKSPYIQNCTNFSDSEIDNSDLNFYSGSQDQGRAGDTDSAVTGGGLLVDGSVVSSSSPLRSMVCDSYTHVGLDGPGVFVTNNGYVQATSSYAFFNHFHIACVNGGQANLAASTTDFGRFSLIADGKSTTAIFTSNVDGAASDGDLTFNINQPAAAASWHGSTTRPQDNMLVEVNGVIYPVLSASAHTDSEGGSGWTVTISRPDPTDTATNLGLNGAVSDNAAVSFYLRSMIASSGHTMEYVGSGTNYSALPENGGVPNDNNQAVERNNGKVWSAITDHKGKFSLGDFFTVDQQAKSISVNPGSFQVDLSTLTVDGTGNAVFGAPLDMGANQITSSTGDLKLNANGDIDAQTNKIINVVDPTDAQDAATKAYVDTQIAGIDEVVEDTTPQLGGDLDANGHDIILDTGTQANPSLTFTGDTNTGIYSPGADQVAISTGGTGRLFVDASGNVGIGASTPNNYANYSTLTLNGTTGGIIDFEAGGTLYGELQALANEFRINAVGASGVLKFYAGASERLRITSDGKVGLGTSSPAGALHVDAASGVDGPIFDSGGTANSSHALLVRDSANNQLLRVNNDGNVGIGTTSPAFGVGSGLEIERAGSATLRIEDSASSSGFEIQNASSSVTFNGYNNQPFIFKHNTDERARIDSSGRLGLGTSSPQAPLHVVGITDGDAIRISQVGQVYKIGRRASDGALMFTGLQTAFTSFRFGTDGNEERVVFDSSGRVGIGTTSPGHSLAVRGAGSNTAVANFFGGTVGRGLVIATDNDGGTGDDTVIYNATQNSGSHVFQVDASEKVRITNSGRVGIGTNSPSYPLTVKTSNTSTVHIWAGGTTFESRLFFGDDDSVNRGSIIYDHNTDSMRLSTSGSLRATVDSSGRLLVGTPTNIDTNSKLQIESDSNDKVVLKATSAVANNGSQVNWYVGSTCKAAIYGGNDDGSRGVLTFSTTADGASSPTERMRITSLGFTKMTNNGSYQSNTGSAHEITSNNATNQVLIVSAKTTSYGQRMVVANCDRSASSSYHFLSTLSSNLADIEHNLRGDGNAYADGSWNGGGADYAEYFEWSDGNIAAEDRRGISVVLDGDKIRAAVAGEEPIGVISGNPSVVGDTDIDRWKGKYLRDDFGTYIQEDYEVEDEDGNTVTQQRRKLNPAYDPDQEYISREDRPEWDTVGLMGKLRIRKGQVTGSRWIKMRDISDNVEEWLVR